MTPVTEGARAPQDPVADAEGHADTPDILAIVLESLDSSKAENIVSIDLLGKSALADGIVVASGRSHRHVGAIADHLLRALKKAGQGTAKVEGLPHCDWVLVDAGDVIVHVFRPEVRAFYGIEKMWADDPADTSHRS